MTFSKSEKILLKVLRKRKYLGKKETRKSDFRIYFTFRVGNDNALQKCIDSLESKGFVIKLKDKKGYYYKLIQKSINVF